MFGSCFRTLAVILFQISFCFCFKVVPLPKSKNKTNNNYRPVSLLSVVSKLLEKHIRLNDYLKKANSFIFFSLFFRRKYSSNTALAHLTDSWLTAMAINNSGASCVVFLALKKAFDLDDHDILFKKLTIYPKNSSSVPCFKSYLHNGTQCVLFHGSYCSEDSVMFGIPYSVLGPILFSILFYFN